MIIPRLLAYSLRNKEQIWEILLSSRYYDPEIGRFISPDSVDYLNPTSINGLNLYAYCYNDPVNWFDDNGNKPKRINGNHLISQGWSWRIDRAFGKTLKHIHVDKNTGNLHYSQNINGKPHDKLTGNPPKWVRDYLRNNGIWDWKDQFSLFKIPLPSISTIPIIQSSWTILSTPTINDESVLESIPISTESFTYESFPLQESGQTVLIIAGVVAVVYVGACIVGAFFTGGQSLWGLVAFA